MTTDPTRDPDRPDDVDDLDDDLDDDLIAVVGMAGRFPESPNVDVFWDNIRSGRDCLHDFTDDELDELGIPAEVYRRPNFVRRGTILPDHDGFDAAFFGFTPKQAGIMDPQARIFLETCYEAIEAAGYDPFATGHEVGVYAGSNPNDYALLLGVADPSDSLGAFDQLIGVDRDFLATRVSHCLGLTGPAMTVQTACSTSLVAVHAAAQSLLSGECSMALAGGVSVNLRQGVGYFYQQGMILSPTGHCRAFDAKAEGTTLGQGCGVVVLKRLADAEADGDNVIAIVRATAINNDGANKISYTAPSEDGQAAAIATAHRLAGIESDTIGYVETHGTGTLLGDPVEIAALTRAFRPGTERTQYCAIGSAKTNFGHTDAAAGITGFMKAVLCLHHRELPPSIHFDEPNPAIDFANSPFYVSRELRPWPGGPSPRRAGVSAFGIGGTNAHVVLEEAPAGRTAPAGGDGGPPRALLVSAKTATAADARIADLAATVDADAPLGAVDFTLRHGRPVFEHRRAVLADADRPVAATLAGTSGATVVRGRADASGSRLVWLFTGQGAQYPSMGDGLYRREPVFADAVDRVARHLEPQLDLDIRTLLFPADDEREAAADALLQTAITQPALFTIEHAMASLLSSWGLEPDVVVGHSIGEFVAGVESGVFRWQDAASLVAERGRLMQSMAPGTMLSVGVAARELEPWLGDDVALAAANSSRMSVASGPADAIAALADRLQQNGIASQALHTSHAFHSPMMDAAVDAFADVVATVELGRPERPMVSNVTGRFLTAAEATDPAFWAAQIRRPVRFADCLGTLAADGPCAFMELGPGRTLCTFVAAHDELGGADDGSPALTIPTMRHPRQQRDDQLVAREAVAALWCRGLDVDWDRVNGETVPRRVPLPAYPFERRAAWLPPHRHVLALPSFGSSPAAATADAAREPIDRWLYAPSWQRRPRGPQADPAGTVVVLAPATPAGRALVDALADLGPLVAVTPGSGFVDDGDRFEVDPASDDDLGRVFASLLERQEPVSTVVHAWLAEGDAGDPETTADLDRSLDLGVHAALACARALSPFGRERPVRLEIVTREAFSVLGTEEVRPQCAALLGPARVVPLEYGGTAVRLIDVATGIDDDADRRAIVDELRTAVEEPDAVTALRAGRRWAPGVALRSTTADESTTPLRRGGRYLIVGGLGGVGLSIGRFLAERYQASLVLTSRRGRPEPSAELDEETGRRLELLDEIERRAAEVTVLAVDAADEDAMTAAVDEIERSGGPLHGVIVAAGVADTGGAIHRRTRQDLAASLASKVHGTLVLERVLAGRQLDFVLLSSSIAATLYHNRFAQVGYVTANAFVEAYAERGRRRGLPVTTVAWDDWLDIGMSVRAARDFATDFGTDVDLVDRLNSFAPDEGVELFDRALRTDEPVLLVSPTDLGRRIREDVDVISPFLEQAIGDDDLDNDRSAADASTLDVVQGIWASLLGFETFRPTDDFFELGGDSLQAARMADRLSRAVGSHVAIDVVFESPVLADLVTALKAIGADRQTPDAEPAEAHGPTPDRVRSAPLGPAQQRFLGRGNPRPDHFNVSVLLEPREPLDIGHLRRAVRTLVARHDAFRASFPTADPFEPPQQVVVPPGDVDPMVELVELGDLPIDEARARLVDHAEATQRDLDLAAGKVAAFVLYQLPAGGQRVLLTFHHLVADRISLLLVIDALEADLRSLAAGETLTADRAASFLDWVDAQARVAGELEAAGGVDRWLDRSWDAVADLPLDHPADRATNVNTSAEAVSITLSSSDLAVDDDARIDELALLALIRAIGEWSLGDAVAIDVLGHGRRLPLDVDVSRSAGMFISYGLTIVDLCRDRQQQLDQIREGIESGWTFDALRRYGSPTAREALDRLPRTDVLFNYVGRAIASDHDALLVATDEPHGVEADPEGRRDHLLAVRADAGDDGGLGLTFVYSTAHHERDTITRLADRMKQFLVGP